MTDGDRLNPEQVMETLVRGVVANSSPAALKKEGDTTLVLYSLPPLVVALQVKDGEVDFVFASCTLKQGLVQVMEADGAVKVETPQRSFPIDPVLQEDIYTTVVTDFKNYSDELQKLSKTVD